MIPDGILQLRKQMLNQEYERLEEQKSQMMEGISSSGSKYETPRDIADEYNTRFQNGKKFPNETRNMY